MFLWEKIWVEQSSVKFVLSEGSSIFRKYNKKSNENIFSELDNFTDLYH